MAFATSAAIPVLDAVLTGDTTLLIYSVFVVALLVRPNVGLFRKPTVPRSFSIGLSVILAGWIAEACAWTSNYIADARQPALLSPQLLSDLLLAVGYYGGWAVAWWVALRRYRFTLTQTFAVTGVLGIFVEQTGSVAASILRSLTVDPLASLLLALYVFTVYGSIMGTAHLLAGFGEDQVGRTDGVAKLVFVAVLMLAASVAFTYALASLGSTAGLLHPPLPIREHPLF